MEPKTIIDIVYLVVMLLVPLAIVYLKKKSAPEKSAEEQKTNRSLWEEVAWWIGEYVRASEQLKKTGMLNNSAEAFTRVKRLVIDHFPWTAMFDKQITDLIDAAVRRMNTEETK